MSIRLGFFVVPARLLRCAAYGLDRPEANRHSFVSLFTSCIVEQPKSSLQKLLRSVIIHGPW